MVKNFVAIDIGSKKLACLLGESLGHHNMVIKSAVVHLSEGIEHGCIVNKEKATSALSSLIYEAEKKFSQDISDVVVNLSSSSLVIKKVKVKSNFNGRQIQVDDMKQILEKTRQKFISDDKEIMSIGFSSHEIEGIGRIEDPEYMFVKDLVSVVDITFVAKKDLNETKELMKACHLNPKLILTPYASSRACLTKEEKKNAIFMDIGGGVTSFCSFSGNEITNAGVLSIGGDAITKDIATYFWVEFNEAEDLKIKYSNLIEQAKGVHIKTLDKEGRNKIIDKKLLNSIIAARIEEIVGMVLNRMPSYNRNTHFVITGGSSNIHGIEIYLNKRHKVTVRVSASCDGGGVEKESKEELYLDAPEFSTLIGLLKFADFSDHKIRSSQQSVFLLKIWEWLKEHF